MTPLIKIEKGHLVRGTDFTWLKKRRHQEKKEKNSRPNQVASVSAFIGRGGAALHLISVAKIKKNRKAGKGVDHVEERS